MAITENDQLAVELFIDDSKADAVLKRNQGRLESFRQEVIAKNQIVATQTTDLFRKLSNNLSSYQKTQLSFQLNDIATSLASGMNPLQVLAQQGGQIVQIIQMSKAEAQGLAAATGAAATSEAAFATSAKAAAISQAQVAVSSEATAAAMTQASASTTVLGASVVSLGAVLAAGLVSILAVWRITEDINAAAQRRLKREEAITGEYNRQNIALAELNKRLREASDARSFGAFTSGDDIAGLQIGLINRQRQRQQLEADVRFQQDRYNKLLQLPGLPADVLKQAFPKQAEDRLKKLDDEIVSITERIENIRRSSRSGIDDFVRGIPQRTIENERNNMRELERLEQERQKKSEEAQRKAEERQRKAEEAQKRQNEAIRGVFTAFGSNNPYVKIYSDADQAMRKLRENTVGLSKETRTLLEHMQRVANQRSLLGQRLDDRLQIEDLRDQARDLRRGFRSGDEEQIRREALRQIAPNWFTQEGREAALQRQMEVIRQQRSREQQADLDRRIAIAQQMGGSEGIQRIIALTQGDPAALSERQRRAGVIAREERAREIAAQEGSTKKFLDTMNTLLSETGQGIKVRLADDSYHLVEVVDESDLSNVTRQPKPSDTQDRRSRAR